MNVEIKRYTRDRIEDAAEFERNLRREEPDIYGWEIDEAYLEGVRATFSDARYDSAVSLLAYAEGRCVGRIDAALLYTHFDGTVSAYLDWICVLKSARHQGVARKLLSELRRLLKEECRAEKLIALMARNEEAQRFYRSVENAQIHDEGIWMY